MSFWTGKRVLVTGHTGFKGSWLSEILLARGSDVYGLALEPETNPALFLQIDLEDRIDHFVGDIRDPVVVEERLKAVRPDVVLHLAAQPLVRSSYRSPLESWTTNVIGTANILEALRRFDHRCAVIIVTTDKVYKIRDSESPFCESDRLGGYDPYSASKAGVEIVADSYRMSFFPDSCIRLATARSGNAIGGGDWSKDRLFPDLARAFSKGDSLKIRNPSSVRPWQHVLDPLIGYLKLAEALVSKNSRKVAASFNFGPELRDHKTVGELVGTSAQHWQGNWEYLSEPKAPYEAKSLFLDINRAKKQLGWAPRWDFARAVSETVSWYKHVDHGGDPAEKTRSQITAFESES